MAAGAGIVNGRIYRYSRILHALHESPKDAAEVAEAIGAAVVATRVTMGRMGALGLIHEVSPPSRYALARWAYGPGPAGSRSDRRMLKPGKAGVSLIHFAALIRAMEAPASAADLSVAIGLSHNTVRNQLAAMRAAHVAYRAEWHREREAGEWAPHWRFGFDTPDKSKPRAIPESVLRARYKAARRAREGSLEIVHALAANATRFTEAA